MKLKGFCWPKQAMLFEQAKRFCVEVPWLGGNISIKRTGGLK